MIIRQYGIENKNPLRARNPATLDHNPRQAGDLPSLKKFRPRNTRKDTEKSEALQSNKKSIHSLYSVYSVGSLFAPQGPLYYFQRSVHPWQMIIPQELSVHREEILPTEHPERHGKFLSVAEQRKFRPFRVFRVFRGQILQPRRGLFISSHALSIQGRK